MVTGLFAIVFEEFAAEEVRNHTDYCKHCHESHNEQDKQICHSAC